MEVKRVGNISHKEFMDEFYQPGIPVVFKNASEIWKANGLFTPDWFRQNFSDRITEVNGRNYTMSEIMDVVESSSEANPAPYPCIFNIPQVLPELKELMEPLHLNYALPNWLDSAWFSKGHWGGVTELFVGGPGGRFPYVHYDYFHLNAWITQLYGQKQFTVFPRGQEDMLYPIPGDPWRSQVNIFEPDYEKHPKYKDATPVNFILGPGETLFIPFGTWHTAFSLTPTISVAFDQLNSKNYSSFLNDVWFFKKNQNKIKAMGVYGYAWLAGQVCRLTRG